MEGVTGRNGFGEPSPELYDDEEAADIPRMPGNDIQNAAARIAQFQAVADVMTRRIELECRRSDDLSKKIAISRGKLDGYRREAGAALASDQDEQQARSRALALAQQRLTVATSRLNTMLRANDDARAGIEHARRDRQTRLAVLGRLRRELEGAKSRAKDTDVQAAAAADGLAKLRTEISTLQDLAAMETDKFEETLSTRVKTFGDTRAAASRKARMELIAGRVSGSPAADEAASPSADADASGSKASPRQQQQAQASLLAMSHSQSTTGGGLGDNGKGGGSINAVQKGGMSAEEETDLKHKGTKASWDIARREREMRGCADQLRELEVAFGVLQAGTGLSGVDDMVAAFMQAEEKNYAVLQMINGLARDIRSADSENSALRAALDTAVARAAGAKTSRDATIKVMDAQVQSAMAATIKYEALYETACKALERLKPSIHSLHTRVGTSASSQALATMMAMSPPRIAAGDGAGSDGEGKHADDQAADDLGHEATGDTAHGTASDANKDATSSPYLTVSQSSVLSQMAAVETRVYELVALSDRARTGAGLLQLGNHLSMTGGYSSTIDSSAYPAALSMGGFDKTTGSVNVSPGHPAAVTTMMSAPVLSRANIRVHVRPLLESATEAALHGYGDSEESGYGSPSYAAGVPQSARLLTERGPLLQQQAPTGRGGFSGAGGSSVTGGGSVGGTTSARGFRGPPPPSLIAPIAPSIADLEEDIGPDPLDTGMGVGVSYDVTAPAADGKISNPLPGLGGKGSATARVTTAAPVNRPLSALTAHTARTGSSTAMTRRERERLLKERDEARAAVDSFLSSAPLSGRALRDHAVHLVQAKLTAAAEAAAVNSATIKTINYSDSAGRYSKALGFNE